MYPRSVPSGGRLRRLFGALVVIQAVHSIEEYAGGLYESFAPARLVSGLVSSDLERGFVIVNTAFVAFGVYCFLGPIRRGSASAITLAWVWVVVEIVNGIGHALWSVGQGAYTPGVATAPVLLLLALLLARELVGNQAKEGERP
jgi:hypothetical protein